MHLVRRDKEERNELRKEWTVSSGGDGVRLRYKWNL